MIKKRVLIGSFILIIAGLFFIVGTDAGITGAAVGISTSALDSASNPLFGFFLVWIACFMLIVNATTLDEIVKSDEKTEKFMSKEPVTKNLANYIEKLKTFGLDANGEVKTISEINARQKQELGDYVMFKRAERYFKEFRPGMYDVFVNGDEQKKLEYLNYYQADTRIKTNEIMKAYEEGEQKGRERIDIESEITKKEMVGIKDTGLTNSFNYIKRHPDKLEEVIKQINSELGWQYKPEFFKDPAHIESLANVYGKYRKEKMERSIRAQEEQASNST